MRSGTISPPKFLGIDVLRTRSSESTEGVNESIKAARNPDVSQFQTPPKGDLDWRAKDMTSIFRPPPSGPATPSAVDLLSIKRCLAFDEADEEAA